MGSLSLKVIIVLSKLEEVGKVVKDKQVSIPVVQARQACYFCDEEGHILMASPNKTCCISCGTHTETKNASIRRPPVKNMG